jgi:hypothetical protein
MARVAAAVALKVGVSRDAAPTAPPPRIADLDASAAAAVARRLRRGAAPKPPPRDALARVAAFGARAAARVRRGGPDPGPLLFHPHIAGAAAPVDPYKRAALERARVGYGFVQRAKIGAIRARLGAAEDAADAAARAAFEASGPEPRDATAGAFARRAASRIRAETATRFVESDAFAERAAVLGDGSAMLGEALEDSRQRAEARAAAAKEAERAAEGRRLAGAADEEPEDPRHAAIRRQLAETRRLVRSYERDVADDPKRAAFRDGVRHLLYRGGDAVPAEDVGLKLAPYRLGPGVPELALSVDGKVDPLPE